MELANGGLNFGNLKGDGENRDGVHLNGISTVCDLSPGKATVVLGAQWGDEAKGKFADFLAAKADIVCRCQGGSNADHHVVVGENEYTFHVLPVGLVHPFVQNIIGNGVVINLPSLFEELAHCHAQGLLNVESRLLISDRAHIVFDFHKQTDGFQEDAKGSNFLGTTKQGIGPTYGSKIGRDGVRIADLLGDFGLFAERFRELCGNYKQIWPNLSVDFEAKLERYKKFAEKVRPMVVDTVHYINSALANGKKILVEGANAAMLDVDLGTYPYVTASNCTIGGVCTGLGIPANRIGEVYGVVKAYTTRVGEGPFPTELKNEIGVYLLTIGREIGRTTGRFRRCGWLDLSVLRYSTMINGYTTLVLTKLDILDDLPEIKIGTRYILNGKPIDRYPATESELLSVEVEYKTVPGWKKSTVNIRRFEDLPSEAKEYIAMIQDYLKVPIKFVSVGPGRDAMIQIF